LQFAIGSSFILLVLCGTMAVYFYRQQTFTADVLTENIGSRGAAANLETTINDLLVLHNRGVTDVEPLHEKTEQHLAEIEEFADKQREKELAAQLTESFQRYRQLWAQRGANGDNRTAAIVLLRNEMLPAAQALRNYNSEQIEASGAEHRETLRRMAWGLGVVGGLGAIASVVLGYGLARSLRQNLHQLLIRVQGASELLSQELPLAEFTPSSAEIGLADRDWRDASSNLLEQVEHIVQKLQQREREIRRAEQLVAVGQLAAGMAHEIRNPLTSIKLLVQTTRHDPSSGSLTEEDLSLIEGEIRRIEQSLQTFLDFARPPKLARSACNLTDLVGEALQLIRGRADQQRVVMQVLARPGPVIAEIDAPQLKQVFVNIGLNAIEAMPTGGKLEVLIESKPDQVVQCTIRDTGEGISKEVLPRLFEPFVTGKETGLGLGLVVSRRIVEEHQGTLHGMNLPDRGAQFIIRLPMRSAH
jgi:two-component system sensor histidine kinase HydH